MYNVQNNMKWKENVHGRVRANHKNFNKAEHIFYFNSAEYNYIPGEFNICQS